MFSQHPDHARAPFWHKEALIGTRDELMECFLMWKELGAEEMMWDWEGKLVDEAVIERLFGEHHAFFKAHPLGKELFLTFRVPNISVESGYRLGRAFMVMLSAAETAKQAGFSVSPLFEVILPMTEHASELLALHEGYWRFAAAVDATFPGKTTPRRFEVIPLFERVRTIFDAARILREYARGYERRFKHKPAYLRPFVARSDPALNSGIVPNTLAIKHALSDCARFSDETGIPTYPIIAPGSLPFRGNLTPKTAGAFAREFAGVRTVVVQSAFRYDYAKKDVLAGVRALKRGLGLTPRLLSAKETADLRRIIPWFEVPYIQTLKEAAPHIQRVAPLIPKRRERMQHIGLFGYSRGVGRLRLPRAIGYTAACYSLGIPPEFFGIGRGIARAVREGKMELVQELYPTLMSSLRRAGAFFRRDSLRDFQLPSLARDIELLEAHFGEFVGPTDTASRAHKRIVHRIVRGLKEGKTSPKQIEEAAYLRKALG